MGGRVIGYLLRVIEEEEVNGQWSLGEDEEAAFFSSYLITNHK